MSLCPERNPMGVGPGGAQLSGPDTPGSGDGAETLREPAAVGQGRARRADGSSFRLLFGK